MAYVPKYQKDRPVGFTMLPTDLPLVKIKLCQVNPQLESGLVKHKTHRPFSLAVGSEVAET